MKQIDLIEREIYSLFPSIVFSSLINDKEFLNQLERSIINLTKDPSAGSFGGNISWISNHFLHKHNDFKKLHNLILKEMITIFDYYGIDYESVYLTSMWANVGYRPEYCHQVHTHPNSMFSGVLHVTNPLNSQGTTFSDPRPSARIIEPSFRQQTPFNSSLVTPKQDRGQLFIFPSYLPHGVPSSNIPYGEGKYRITISFNAMMTGEIITHTSPLTLK